MSGSARAHPHLARALASTAGGFVVLEAVLVLRGDQAAGLWRDVVVFNVPYVVAFVALVWATHHARMRGREWQAWAWIAAAILSTLAANVYYTVVLSPMVDPPYPSWSDVGYLVFYPQVYVGLTRLVRSRIAHWHTSLWLDGLIGFLTVAALVVQVALEPMVELSGGRLDVALVNLAYPLGDALLLAMIVGTVVLIGARFDRQWWLLGLGMAVMAAADLGYAVLDAAGLYLEGNPVDVGFSASALLIALAALREVRRGPVPPHEVAAGRFSQLALIGLPTVAAAISLVLLAPVALWEQSHLAQWLALGALGIATLRILLTYHEVQAATTARALARTDELTGLLNRRGFLTTAEAIIGQGVRLADLARGVPGPALLLLDLDGFKEINDSLGHAAGDQLLIEVARRLATTLRHPEDLLARLGGDEFAVVLASAEAPAATATAERMNQALHAPVRLGDHHVRIAVSIGIALAPMHADNLRELLSRADVAMYRAKTARLGHATFDPTRGDQGERARLAARATLRHALATGLLATTWRDACDPTTGRRASREVTVHLPGADGTGNPRSLTMAARELRLLPEVTATAIDLGLRAASTWTDEPPLPVTVHIPTESLNDQHLPATVATLLARHELTGERLVLKVAEDGLLSDRDHATATLTRLHDLGVRWCLDGFGSPTSVLGYLTSLPIAGISLHPHLTRAALGDPNGAELLRTVSDLAHQLDLVVTGDLDGEADRDSAQTLQQLGCDLLLLPSTLA